LGRRKQGRIASPDAGHLVLHVCDAPLSPAAARLKRMEDILLSAMLLILLSPLFVMIAIGIKLATPHLPVFYPWRVIGLKGRSFTGYKFTTMAEDADEKRNETHRLQIELKSRQHLFHFSPAFRRRRHRRVRRKLLPQFRSDPFGIGPWGKTQ
jgi:lipopolysaccharide/colanic/teichoic acid biosynthesis glycosyltransferase